MMFNVSVTHIKQVVIKYSMLEPSPTVMWKNKRFQLVNWLNIKLTNDTGKNNIE